MPSRVSVVAGPVTRTFTVLRSGRPHTVSLFHNTITGERSLNVNGAEISGTTGSTTVFSGRTALVFEIDGGRGEVWIWPSSMTHFEYTCNFSGAEIPEENSIVGDDSLTASVEAVNRLRITVDAGDAGVDEAGKPVVWFRLHTIRESDANEVIVHRRFREFVAVNEALRSAYKGSHLLSALPDLPPRTVAGSFVASLFGRADSALDPKFVEERRWKLQDWAYKMAQVPRMRMNPDFLTFLGCVDAAREVSVMFPPDVPLGLSLKQAGEFSEVAALKPLPDGRPSPAQLSGLVSVGDKVSKINGEPVLGDSHEVVIAKLKAAPRPLMIHFLGLFPTRPRTSEEELARAAAAKLATVSLADDGHASASAGAGAGAGAHAAAAEPAVAVGGAGAAAVSAAPAAAFAAVETAPAAAAERPAVAEPAATTAVSHEAPAAAAAPPAASPKADDEDAEHAAAFGGGLGVL